MGKSTTVDYLHIIDLSPDIIDIQYSSTKRKPSKFHAVVQDIIYPNTNNQTHIFH